MIKKTKQYHKVKFATYDIETLGLIPVNFLYGVVNYGDEYKVFTDKHKMFAEMIQRKNYGKKFLAHNCEYDLTGILNTNLIKFFGKGDILYRGSHLISARYPAWIDETGRYRKCVYFWDSFRFLLSSLKEIGKTLGYEKLNTPKVLLNTDNLEYKDFKKDFKLTPELTKYCLRDTQILYKAIDEFQNFIYDKYGCSLKATISSIAFSIWKKCYMEIDKWDDCNLKPNLAFKNSYYGGRVDVFKWGHTKDINYYDINSLYPYCGLKKFPHPYKLYYSDDPDIYHDHEGCGLFEIIAPNIHIPCLPYRFKGKLLFPIGVWEGWYNFNEIRYAKSLGYRVKFKYGYFSYVTKYPLKNYYNVMYDVRSKTPKSHYYNLILKYLLNSLYGRFGLKIENKEYMYDHEFFDIALDPNHKLHEIYKNWDFIELSDDNDLGKFGYAYSVDDPFYIHETTYYAIPSYVTSYARIELHKHLMEYKNVVYCDTDSIFLDNNEELHPGEVCNDLGKFKHEGSYKKGWFLGCKFYVLDNKVKIKGIRTNDLHNIYEIPPEIEQNSYFKNKESLRRNKKAGTLKEMTKQINPKTFNKRIYNDNIDYYTQNSVTYPISI